MQINRDQFITQLAARQHCTKTEAAQRLDDVLSTITENVSAGNAVAFHGFGQFTVQFRKDSVRRLFETGEMVDVPAHRAVRFRAGKRLQEAAKRARQHDISN